ncbi:hypothetical protein MDOR_10120 [Mycolicibacterium doricum]|uniref:Transposase n=1 Tax=Mycolicibacterium doricum TaxID=126673 RepID=A0A7I7VRR0_9MYCO|nr:hypothetical protein MDOR_10120 [Mycolicibacterium doricum]
MLQWNKTRWRCREDYCERGSFTESIAQVPARARTTLRLRTQVGAAIGDAARSVAEVADSHGVSWPTAHRAFVAHAESLLVEPQPAAVLGIDETRRGKPRWERCAATQRWTRVDPWDTGFVDLAGDQGLLGQREGRSSATVIDWLRERSEEFRAGVQFVAIDPAAVYATAIPHPGPAAERDDRGRSLPSGEARQRRGHQVRRRVTWDLRDRRGRKLDPEWANRRRLLRARECLSDKSFAKMWNAIVAEDDSAQILSAWIAKEELRTVLSTVRVGGDPHLTRHRLHRFLSWCIDSQIPELLTLAATVDTWCPRSTPSSKPESPTPAPRDTTGSSSRSSASAAASGIETTRPAGYDSTAPANSGPQPRHHADCPLKIEEPVCRIVSARFAVAITAMPVEMHSAHCITASIHLVPANPQREPVHEHFVAGAPWRYVGLRHSALVAAHTAGEESTSIS